MRPIVPRPFLFLPQPALNAVSDPSPGFLCTPFSRYSFSILPYEKLQDLRRCKAHDDTSSSTYHVVVFPVGSPKCM